MWLNQIIEQDTMAIDFRYKAGGGSGGDGFVVMVYKDKKYTPAVGGELGFMGEGDLDVTGYGIEFDSYKNLAYNDPSNNHIALIRNHVDDHIEQVHDYKVNDNEWHTVKVILRDKSYVKLYVDDMRTPLIETEAEIVPFFGGFGFGAGTGNKSQTHLIDDVRITIPMKDSFTVTTNNSHGGEISPSEVTEVTFGNTVDLNIEPDPGYQIMSVIGCDGTLDGSIYTTASVIEDCTVVANFSEITYTLQVVKEGLDSGMVTSSPGGIYCGTDCQENYGSGTTVTLTAAPAELFKGWSGGGCTGTGNCIIEMDDDITITATFGLNCNNASEGVDSASYVATSGDFNSDGHVDLVYGYRYFANSSGKIVVLYGPDYECTKSFSQDSPGMSGGSEHLDYFSYSVAAGDINGDGYADLAIGVPGENNNTGFVSIIFGSIAGLTSDDDQFISQDTSGIEGGAEEGDYFGGSLAIGDFDMDGFADLAIGVPRENNRQGYINVIYGSSSGLTSENNAMFRQGLNGIRGGSEAYDNFGYSLASGDFDNDGYADLVIGIPFKDLGTGEQHEDAGLATCDLHSPPCDTCEYDSWTGHICRWVDFTENAGSIAVLYGSESGINANGNQRFEQDTAGIKGGSEENDVFGWSVASGDLNGDGYDDVVVGVMGENDYAGEVNVIYGSHSGLTANGDRMIGQNTNGMLGTGEAGDGFGMSLTYGDFNHDGYDDIGIEVGEGEVEGWMSIIYGSNSGLTTENNRLEPMPFRAWEPSPLSIQTPENILVPIIDQAGNIDIILSNEREAALIEETVGNPQESWNWSFSSDGTIDKPLGIGNYDNEGHKDIFIINSNGDMHAIMLNNGAISKKHLGNTSTLGLDFNSNSTQILPLGVGDMNGDTIADIVIIDQNGDISAIVNVHKNRPSNSFTLLYLGNVNSQWNWSLAADQNCNDKPLGVGDIDGDGLDDVIIVNGAGTISAIRFPDPGSGLAEKMYYIGNPKVEWGWSLDSQSNEDLPLGVGDVNGDNHDDIVILRTEQKQIEIIYTYGETQHITHEEIVDTYSTNLTGPNQYMYTLCSDYYEGGNNQRECVSELLTDPLIMQKKPMIPFGWWIWW